MTELTRKEIEYYANSPMQKRTVRMIADMALRTHDSEAENTRLLQAIREAKTRCELFSDAWYRLDAALEDATSPPESEPCEHPSHEFSERAGRWVCEHCGEKTNTPRSHYSDAPHTPEQTGASPLSRLVAYAIHGGMDMPEADKCRREVLVDNDPPGQTGDALAALDALVLKAGKEACGEEYSIVRRHLTASGVPDWTPSEGDYDRSIHSNPDQYAWADFFLHTFPNCGADRDTMAGWFANAMMAKHDSMPDSGVPYPINVVFDGPPSATSGRFVEVETDDGRSVRVGEWIEREDGLWSLRIDCSGVPYVPERKELSDERIRDMLAENKMFRKGVSISYTRWRDGIDVEMPTLEMKRFTRAVWNEALAAASSVSGVPYVPDQTECASCSEGVPKNECTESKRPCGHHCNHSWTQDICHWCGEEFGEETDDE